MNRIVIFSFLLLTIGCTTDNKVTAQEKATLCDITHRTADTMPHFPGGDDGFAKHIIELYEPIECAKGKLTKIGLIINKEGKVIGGIHKGFSGDCADQLNAKLSEMAPWTPGAIAGKPVCVQIEIEVAAPLEEPAQR